MSKHLEDFLKRNRELAEAASPAPWFQGYWSGQCHKNHAHFGPPDCEYTYTRQTEGDYAKSTVSSGATENMEICSDVPPKTAEFIAASRTSLPLALELLSMARAALEQISKKRPHAIGIDHAEAQTAHLQLIARSALAALEEKAGRG